MFTQYFLALLKYLGSVVLYASEKMSKIISVEIGSKHNIRYRFTGKKLFKPAYLSKIFLLN